MKVSRHDALTRLAAGGVGAVLAPAIIRGQTAPIIVAGRPVEILVRPLGEFTVRISVRPIVDGKPQPVINRGALAAPAGGNESRIETGDMVVSVREGVPTTIEVRRRGRIVQTLSLDPVESTIAFAIGNGPIYGLGEGGPQFDRRGTQYPSRNGQGGYQLRTHGGRVPIQWLVSTDGWGMYIHQPLGSFDLTGSIGRLMPSNETIVGINGVSGGASASVPLGVVDTFTLAGFQPGTYTFSVRSSNSAGTSTASNSVTLTFPSVRSGSPLPPVGFTATNAGSVVTLAWELADSGPAPTGFLMHVSGDFVGSLPTAVRTLTGPVGAGTYTVSVAATNPCGVSAPAASRTLTVP